MGFNCLTSMPAKQFHTPTNHRFYINVDSHHDQQGLLHLCRLCSEIECLQQFQMLRDILYHVVSPICSPHPRLATGNLTWHHTVWAPSRYVICYKLPVRIKQLVIYSRILNTRLTFMFFSLFIGIIQTRQKHKPTCLVTCTDRIRLWRYVINIYNFLCENYVLKDFSRLLLYNLVYFILYIHFTIFHTLVY